MRRATMRRLAGPLALGAAGTLGVAACGDTFPTEPGGRTTATVSFETSGGDTVVLGQPRALRAVVRDGRGREIQGAQLQWENGAPALLAGALPAGMDATSPAQGSVYGVTGLRTGTGAVTVRLTDPRFGGATGTWRPVVVVAGVRAATPGALTFTAVGDTLPAVVSGQGLDAAGALVAHAGTGITWMRRGTGAVALVGSGDSVRVVATAAGTDTLFVTNPLCRAATSGATCTATIVVRVAPRARSLGLAGRTYRAWSLGDSVVPAALVQDARGHVIAGASLTLLPLTAADSAIVTVGPAATPSAMPPMIARGNGTAQVIVRAVAADGAELGADTVQVAVRQVAASVHVEPAEAVLTPGASIPVSVTARDARGHPIADATFTPTPGSGLTWAGGRLTVDAGATGTPTLAMVVTGAAAPASHADAPVAASLADTSRVTVQPAPQATADDPATTSGTALTATVLDAAGQPLVGAWVRFTVPAGTIAGGIDSVQTDGAGLATLTWVLPTTVGQYTATATVLGRAPADSAGAIVLRRTAEVTAGAAAGLALHVAPATSVGLGAALAPVPAVRLQDAYGNVVRQAGIPVALALDVPAMGFTLGGTLTVATDADGIAGFPGVSGSGPAGVHALRFTATPPSAPSLPPLVVGPVSFETGAASAATSTLTVGATTIGLGDTTTVTVVLKDAAGNVVTTATPSAVTLGADVGTLGTVGCTAGTCTARYTAPGSGGTATITATVGGTGIVGSPQAITVSSSMTVTTAIAARVLTEGRATPAFVPVTASGGALPRTFAITTGTLPTGLAFDATTGAISGTPTVTVGTTTFTVTVTDAASATGAASFDLTVNPALVASTAVPSASGTTGTPVPPFTPVTVAGGTTPVTYAIAPALPAGMTFATGTGEVAGTPTAPLPATVYTVTATDANGATSQATFTLQVNGAPDAPTALAATVSGTTGTVTWGAPAYDGGTAVTAYTLEVSENGGTSWTLRSASATSPHTHGSLVNGTTYTYRVRASNTTGDGAWSPLVSITPGTPDAPAMPTVTFNQTSATAQTGTVGWTAPATNGSAILDYTVDVSSDGGSTWASSTSTSSPRSYTTLLPRTEYRFRVRARNARGLGPWSPVRIDTTTGASERLACVTPGNSNSSTNSATVVPCSGLQIGNVILVPVTIAASDVISTAEAGFSVVGTMTNGAMRTTVFKKVVTAGDVGRTTGYTFTWSSNVKTVVTLVAYKQVNAAGITMQANVGTGPPATSGVASVVGATDYTLAYFFSSLETAMSSTTPSVGEWTVSDGLWKNTTAGANNAQAAAVVTGDVDKPAAVTSTAAQTATTASLSASDPWIVTTIVLPKQ